MEYISCASNLEYIREREERVGVKWAGGRRRKVFELWSEIVLQTIQLLEELLDKGVKEKEKNMEWYNGREREA